MKIKVYKEPWNDRLGVLLYEDGSDGKHYVVKPVEIQAEAVGEGSPIEPTFYVPRRGVHDFLKSMAEMAESMGIKTDKQLTQDFRYQGKLESTERHLEDMRTLVFRKPKSKS